MPFKLTNAPAAFQRFMNDIFSDLLDVSMIIYLCENGLYAHLDKCCFSEDAIKYLVFILSKDGLKTDPSKVQTIQDWPEPCKVKDVQSFLGFTNFYCRFISDYSAIMVPLTWLTHKGIPWNFTDAAQKSF